MCTLDRLLTSNLMCWDVEKTTVLHCEVCQKSTRVQWSRSVAAAHQLTMHGMEQAAGAAGKVHAHMHERRWLTLQCGLVVRPY